MKHLYLIAAAAAALVSVPANAATNFQVNSAASSVIATNNASFCFGCNVSASLATFSPFALNVGQSQTFSFANYNFSGIGFGSATVNAVLAFSDPFAVSAGSSASTNYLSVGGIFTGGALTWSNATQTLTGTNGTQFSVQFNNLAGITTGNTATSTVTVRLLAAAVPEPATWAMMMLGFGMVAGAARYRRRSVSATYA